VETSLTATQRMGAVSWGASPAVSMEMRNESPSRATTHPDAGGSTAGGMTSSCVRAHAVSEPRMSAEEATRRINMDSAVSKCSFAI